MAATLIADFGFRLLTILQAVAQGDPIESGTVWRIQVCGLADYIGPDGALQLTPSGREMLTYLIALDDVPEEYVALYVPPKSPVPAFRLTRQPGDSDPERG